MNITESHVAFLRAYLHGDEDAATSAWSQITAPDGLALLVHTALGIAARRQFAPAWTRADVIRYVTRVRAALSDRPDILDPRTAEHELRRALGDTIITSADRSGAVATAHLILLNALAASRDLDEAGLDLLLHEARDVADSMLAVTSAPDEPTR
jgi:hypothetical protein